MRCLMMFNFWWPYLMGILFGFCLSFDVDPQNIKIYSEDVKRVWASDFCGNDDCRRIIGYALESKFYQNHKPG